MDEAQKRKKPSPARVAVRAADWAAPFSRPKSVKIENYNTPNTPGTLDFSMQIQ